MFYTIYCQMNIKRESPITVLAHHNVIETSSNTYTQIHCRKRLEFEQAETLVKVIIHNL